MLFMPEISSPGDGRTAVGVDELANTGSKLTQLHNFFEHHSFDTVGPYSDLFSVLLCCCKHLVDTGLHHHAVLSSQRQEIAHLSSGEALLNSTARCQESVRNLESVSAETQFEVWNKEGLPLLEAEVKSSRVDLDVVSKRLDDADERLQSTETVVSNFQSRQKEYEEEHGKLQLRQKSVEDHINQLEEDIVKLKRGISAHAEYIGREVATIKNGASLPSSLTEELVSELKLYTDKKLDALKDELCIALEEAASVNDVAHTRSSPSHSPGCYTDRDSATIGNGLSGSNSGADGNAAKREKLSFHLQQIVSRSLRAMHAHIDEVESRLEVMEIYAPHQSAMAARPPLLGVELRDEKNLGVRVDKVFRGFPGESSGMMPGDIVIAVNNREVLTRAEMYAVMTELIRENQSRRRLLMQLFFEEHTTGQRKMCGMVENKSDHRDVLESHSVCGANFDYNKSLKLPQLELKFHLKRGGLLCEARITVDDGLVSS